MPDRWHRSQTILSRLNLSVQCVTYDGTSHRIRPEMLEDVVAFFLANEDDAHVEVQPYEYAFVPHRGITEAHVRGLHWRGDSRLPEHYRSLVGQATFAVSIADWMKGQDHQQLGIFVRKAGFEFVLRADGRRPVRITQRSFCGTRSGGDGDFQAFGVRLSPEQVGAIESGTRYTLHPVTKGDRYRWDVNEGVVLVKP